MNITLEQYNQYCSTKGVLRVLRFQNQYPRIKLVRVIKNSVFDVAVEIVTGSETYGVELTEESNKQNIIAKEFANEFLVLSEVAEFRYKCDDFYHANDEGGLVWNDSEIGEYWPRIVGDYK